MNTEDIVFAGLLVVRCFRRPHAHGDGVANWPRHRRQNRERNITSQVVRGTRAHHADGNLGIGMEWRLSLKSETRKDRGREGWEEGMEGRPAAACSTSQLAIAQNVHSMPVRVVRTRARCQEGDLNAAENEHLSIDDRDTDNRQRPSMLRSSIGAMAMRKIAGVFLSDLNGAGELARLPYVTPLRTTRVPYQLTHT